METGLPETAFRMRCAVVRMNTSSCLAASMDQCRHPIWQSEGTCSVASAAAQQQGVDSNVVCPCGAGFVSKDSLGNASCVPGLALIGIFASVGAMACLAFAIVLCKAWRARGGRGLVESSKVNRKARVVARFMAITRCDT